VIRKHLSPAKLLALIAVPGRRLELRSDRPENH